MRHRKQFLIAAMLLAGVSHAQTVGEIHGKVFDSQGSPLFMATVSAERGDVLVGTTADEQGRFVIKPLMPGIYTLRVSYVGMVPHELSSIQVNAEKITRLSDIVLMSNTELPEVKIEAFRWTPPLIDVAEPTKLTFVASQLEDNPLRKDPVSMISTLSPDIYKQPGTDNLYFRGSRSDGMAYFVDGVKVPGQLSGVPPASIGSITLYTGGLPARYGDVVGGVVAIESKSYFDLYMQRQAQQQ
jgi:hypothetical protein